MHVSHPRQTLSRMKGKSRRLLVQTCIFWFIFVLTDYSLSLPPPSSSLHPSFPSLFLNLLPFLPPSLLPSLPLSLPLSLPPSVPPLSGPDGNCPFLPVSQDSYREHSSPITHCKFSPNATQVATVDTDGKMRWVGTAPTDRHFAEVWLCMLLKGEVSWLLVFCVS